MRASRKSLLKGFDACGPPATHFLKVLMLAGAPANHFLKVLMLAGLPQITFKRIWCLRDSRKSFRKRFSISAHGESRFPKGLAFPRMAKVISRKVWHFRAWRKSFSEWFSISAHGESHFPKGLAFPRMAKVFSRSVCCLPSLSFKAQLWENVHNVINSTEGSDILVFNCYFCHVRFLLTCYVCSTKIGGISDISKYFENFVSQALGFLKRFYAAELRAYNYQLACNIHNTVLWLMKLSYSAT